LSKFDLFMKSFMNSAVVDVCNIKNRHHSLDWIRLQQDGESDSESRGVEGRRVNSSERVQQLGGLTDKSMVFVGPDVGCWSQH